MLGGWCKGEKVGRVRRRRRDRWDAQKKGEKILQKDLLGGPSASPEQTPMFYCV